MWDPDFHNHREVTMKADLFIGMDVHKETIAVAVAGADVGSEVRFYGNVSNKPDVIEKLAKKLTKDAAHACFVYEAGPCGYIIQRQLSALGFECRIAAPGSIVKRPTDRIKNDHRDAVGLARLCRANELSYVWIPDEIHEAMRDLIRARHATTHDVKAAKIRLQSYLLKYDIRYEGKAWTHRHRVWLTDRQFSQAPQQIVFQTYLNALEQHEGRRAQIDDQIRELIPNWKLGPIVRNLQALKGVAQVVAATIVVEAGDINRFQSPKQLMAFFGLIPGEHSSGGSFRPRGITKTGSTHARTMLFEAAWSYTKTPKKGQYMCKMEPLGIPQNAKDIAWKAQLRLHKRYKTLAASGKRSTIAITAVARELVGFAWAIAKETEMTA